MAGGFIPIFSLSGSEKVETACESGHWSFKMVAMDGFQDATIMTGTEPFYRLKQHYYTGGSVWCPQQKLHAKFHLYRSSCFTENHDSANFILVAMHNHIY